MPLADLTDCRLHYELKGEGDPLLMIPGLGCTTQFWDPVVDELAREFCLVMVEMRGVGRSVEKRRARTLNDYCSDMVELLDHLHIERVHLLGQSLGGITAQRFVGLHPTRINRLVLISCARSFGPYLREMAHLIGQTLRRFPRPVYLRAMSMLSTGPLWLDANPELVRERIARDMEQGPDRRALAVQLRALGSQKEAVPVDHISAPTLVIAGEHDALIPSCYARQLAEAIPDSRLLLIANAGHNPLVERSEVVVPAICRFLESGQLMDVRPPHRLELVRDAG